MRCDTANVYFPGARKKKRYTPSPSVLAVWIVPLVTSLSSTTALGTTAWLGSLTTPVKPPEVVVWARESWIEQRTRKRITRSWIGSFHLVEEYSRFQGSFRTGFTTCERDGNTTLFSCLKLQPIVASGPEARCEAWPASCCLSEGRSSNAAKSREGMFFV